jgi:hypothetical protein
VSYSCPFCHQSLVDGQTPTDEWAWVTDDQPAHQSCYYESQPPTLSFHQYWEDAAKARRWHAEGRLETDEYLAGLFFHPDYRLYWDETERLTGVPSPLAYV